MKKRRLGIGKVVPIKAENTEEIKHDKYKKNKGIFAHLV
jgi:hypothetical protein